MATLSALEDWLVAIAQHTRESKEHLERIAKRGTGGAGGTGLGASGYDPDATRWERMFEALGRRFESALSRWSKTPSQVLVSDAFNAATRRLDMAASTMIGQSRSLVSRGFSGTFEQQRFEYSLDLLGRQFAAIFSPILNGFTYLAARLEPMLRALTGTEQNRLMGGGIGALIGYRMGGPLGALAGFGLGSAFVPGGGESTGGAMVAAASGAYLGARVAGIPGALLAGTAAAATAAPGRYETERPSDYYARMRAGGATRFGAAFSTAGESISALFSGPRPGAPPAPTPPAPRRDVTPAHLDMGEAGQLHFLLQRDLIRATAPAGYEDTSNPLKPFMDVLLQIVQLLMMIAIPGYTPPPSAERAR